MLLRNSISILAAASAATALKDASPFFLLSTLQHSNDLHSRQLSTSTHLEDTLSKALSTTCDSSLYIFVEHPGLHAEDLRHADAMPKMGRRLKREEYQTVMQIPEVIEGEVDIAQLAKLVSRECGVEQTSLEDAATRKGSKAVVSIQQSILRPADAEIRRQSLRDMDALLDSQLHSILANHTAHTIVYVAVPASERHEGELYWEQEDEPPFQSGMHLDLKRDVDTGFARRQESGGSKNPQDGLPLFEKYQFLSPGIFMGLTVALLLFLILYVGVSAIAGLEVSYMSFSKEMGPNAQKKQQ